MRSQHQRPELLEIVLTFTIQIDESLLIRVLIRWITIRDGPFEKEAGGVRPEKSIQSKYLKTTPRPPSLL
jgi:hypothetical protein